MIFHCLQTTLSKPINNATPNYDDNYHIATEHRNKQRKKKKKNEEEQRKRFSGTFLACTTHIFLYDFCFPSIPFMFWWQQPKETNRKSQISLHKQSQKQILLALLQYSNSQKIHQTRRFFNKFFNHIRTSKEWRTKMLKFWVDRENEKNERRTQKVNRVEHWSVRSDGILSFYKIFWVGISLYFWRFLFVAGIASNIRNWNIFRSFERQTFFVLIFPHWN